MGNTVFTQPSADGQSRYEIQIDTDMRPTRPEEGPVGDCFYVFDVWAPLVGEEGEDIFEIGIANDLDGAKKIISADEAEKAYNKAHPPYSTEVIS